LAGDSGAGGRRADPQAGVQAPAVRGPRSSRRWLGTKLGAINQTGIGQKGTRLVGRRAVMDCQAAFSARVLVAATLTALTGCSALGHCASAACAEDTTTAAAVAVALSADKEILPGSIHVLVHARVAYLYGIADTDVERFHAESIAKSTTGVSRVVDFIGISNR
jgi:hypothetical protein